MLKSQRVKKPQKASIILSVVIALLAYFGSQTSPFIGYLLAISFLLALIAASLLNSFWPTKGKKENSFIFSLFWGLLIGVLLPFILTTYKEGGVDAIMDLL